MGRGKITNPLKPISINAMKNRPINIISGHIFSVPLFSALFITAVLFTVSPFSAPLFAQSKETGVLYLWDISSGKVWKNFGDDDSQQKYKGEIKGGLPDGLGFTLFTDGTKYMGQWQDGKQHGHGTFIFLTGEKMSGEWEKNEEWNITKYDINGNIIARYADGVLLIDNKKEGVLFYRQEFGNLGWFTTGNEEKDYKYEGEIENGKPNGWGKFTYPSGSMHEGEYKEGKYHGQGTFTFAKGKKVVGEFKENKPWNVTEFDKDGNIIAKYAEGVELVEKKAKGVLFTRKVKGEWIWFENGIADDGGKYEGEIENGKPNGKGTLIYRNGTRYVGEYLDGTWNGQGSFYFPDGEKWVGEFKEDAPWNITWFDRDGNIIVKWGDGVKQK